MLKKSMKYMVFRPSFASGARRTLLLIPAHCLKERIHPDSDLFFRWQTMFWKSYTEHAGSFFMIQILCFCKAVFQEIHTCQRNSIAYLCKRLFFFF